MSLHKNLRIKYFQDWKVFLGKTPGKLIFPIEEEYMKRIGENSKYDYFKPFKFKYCEDDHYHRVLSNMIDALEFLPLRPEVSFDFIWKANETYMGYIDSIRNPSHKSNITDLLNKTMEDIWLNQISTDEELRELFLEYCKFIPLQTCEFFIKAFFNSYDDNKVIVESNKLTLTKGQDSFYIRLAKKRSDENENLKIILHLLYRKYGVNESRGKNLRNSSLLLKKMFNNELIDFDCNKIKDEKTNELLENLNEDEKELLELKYSLTEFDKLTIIIKGMLYTYRNERFHGNLFSPFKSSKATFKTYAHAHYLFLVTHFFVLLLFKEESIIDLKIQDIIENSLYNLKSFANLYGKHLTD
ncbi:hypothetical protein CCS79_09960 [Clostridium diolis]|uniref:hypothetical protein n=1 Tax=Clostridium diolis TaxID=223919 RepID=UPI000B3F8875|nr:hypothetical protein [Clostridium diolis]OVE68231.1 hypothetical protein CCS79_09960 [Clostridium diolis]